MQLASGHDLTGGLLTTTPDNANPDNANRVNRSDKADRAATASTATSILNVVPMKTVSMQFSQFAGTSFLLRLPVMPSGATDVADETRPAPSLLIKDSKQGESKRPIACEPMVSVLTEVAKRLQPGRCVT
jgi:hypothetical protein